MTISLAEFKDLLGPFADTLTEDQIKWLYDAEYKLADAIFEWWLRNRNTHAQIDQKPEKEDTVSNSIHETDVHPT